MYKEYHRLWYLMILAKKDLEKSQLKYDNILEQTTNITVSLKSDIVGGSSDSDKLGELIAKKLDLEPIIASQKELYKSRRQIVDEKLEELKSSEETKDKAYRLKFISKCKVKEIAKVIDYSDGYTYNLICEIRKEMFSIEEKERKNRQKNASS
ncbi:MAG: hypothetical protein OSJ70_04930 [Bacilli bacterium]|nr:hypothetical protein [Bacilli bacterium]